jgi:hypothetical protein
MEILSNRSKIPPWIKLIVCLLQERSQQDNGEAFIGDITPEFQVGEQQGHRWCTGLIEFPKGSLSIQNGQDQR